MSAVLSVFKREFLSYFATPLAAVYSGHQFGRRRESLLGPDTLEQTHSQPLPVQIARPAREVRLESRSR